MSGAKYFWGPVSAFGLAVAATACVLDQAVKLWLLFVFKLADRGVAFALGRLSKQRPGLLQRLSIRRRERKMGETDPLHLPTRRGKMAFVLVSRRSTSRGCPAMGDLGRGRDRDRAPEKRGGW